MKRTTSILAATAALLSATTTVIAVPIYANPLNNTLSGYGSNDPAAGSSQQIADDFMFASSQIIASITWYGNYVNDQFGAGHASAFTLRLFADIGDGTSPVNSAPFYSLDVTASAIATGVTSVDNHDVLSYSANLPSSVSLSSGTYWLSIVESDPSTTSEAWEWASTESGSGATNVRRLPEAGGPVEIPTPNWIPVGTGARENRAFILDNEPQPVPDGGRTIVLLFASCVLVGIAKLRFSVQSQ